MRNTVHRRDKDIRRQAERVAPKVWKVANAAARKAGYSGNGFHQKWNDASGYTDNYLTARQAGWIAAIEYVLTIRLSPRVLNTNAHRKKPKTKRG